MIPEKELIERFESLLDEFDALAAEADGDAAESMDDLNAEFEDALMLLSQIKPDDPDGAEALQDALEDLLALAGDYKSLAATVPGVGEVAARLSEAARASMRQ